VAEVERCQINKVEDENQLGPAKIASHKKHDKRELEEIIENEVTADGGGGVERVNIGGEEVGDITTLKDEQNNPDNCNR
jgi:hypothetical protein